jgi:hypothetical protein
MPMLNIWPTSLMVATIPEEPHEGSQERTGGGDEKDCLSIYGFLHRFIVADFHQEGFLFLEGRRKRITESL